MWRRSDNLVHKLAIRELSAASPSSHIHRARLMYENIVPNHTVYDVDCPDHYFRKFTNDGQYLICFSRNWQYVVVYRFNGLSYCSKGECFDITDGFPAKWKMFDSYFSHLYTLNLGSDYEIICKDIFLTTECNRYGIFATATKDSDSSRRPGTVTEIPSKEKITLYLVRLADGTTMDQKKFHDDFIQLVHGDGIFMYDDLVTVLSLRHQTIHILQVRKSGTFVDVRTVGPFCREDDELVLSSHEQKESLFQNQKITCQGGNNGRRSMLRTYGDSQETGQGCNTLLSGDNYENMGSNDVETSNVQNHLVNEAGGSTTRNPMLGGIKQRLLSYIFRSIESHDTDSLMKSNRFKRFYYHFQQYMDLVMWKVQFLDRYHLLIKFGSMDGVVSQSLDSTQTVFFVIYNIESTEVLGFFQNTSDELLRLFENYHDHFRAVPSYPLYMRFISSYSNNVFAREQFRKQKAACHSTKQQGHSLVIKRTLASLPCSAQSQSPSVYFDQNLFQFDEKHISASTDQYKPCMEHPIKFISRRKPNALRFKINPGHELGPGDSHTKRLASFIFHPIFPFAISVQQAYMEPAIVNFHFRR